MLSYESKFSRHTRNMDNAAEHFMFFKWKNKFGVKNKGTILFTNHFDLGQELLFRLKRKFAC